MEITKERVGRCAGSLATGLLFGVLGLMALIGVAGGISYWVNGLTKPVVRVEAPVTQDTPVRLPPGVAGEVSASLNYGSTATVEITDGPATTGPAKLLYRTDDLVQGVALGVGAWLLGLVVDNIGRGRAFHRRNPGYVFGIAICVLAGGCLAPLLAGAFRMVTLERAGLMGDGSPLGATMDVPVEWILLAGVLAVVAVAFRRGVVLTRELEGLV